MNSNFSSVREAFSHEGFRRYFKNTGWPFVARIINMAVSFFVLIYVTRYLGPANYGQLSYAISFTALFGVLANLGIDQILYRELLASPQKEKEILSTSFLLKLTGGVIATLIVVFISLNFIEEEISRFLIAIIAFSFLFQPWNVLNYAFQAKVESKYPSAISIGVGIFLSLLKIAIIFFNKGIIYFAIVFAIEPLLYAIMYVIFYCLRYGSFRFWIFDKDTAVRIFRDSLPLILSGVAIVVYSRIDQVMLKHYIDTTAVGIYDAAVRISEIWYFIPAIIVSSLFPAIMNAKKTNDEMYRKRFKNLYSLILVISLVISILFTIFSGLIINILYGHEFMASAAILRIYGWSGIFVSLAAVTNQYLLAENYTKLLFWSAFIGMIVNIGLNIFLIPAYGLEGAAFATLISYAFIPFSLFFFAKTRRHAKLIFSALKFKS